MAVPPSDPPVRIVSEGTTRTTRVYIGDTPLNNVTSVTWQLDASQFTARAHLELVGVDVELIAGRDDTTITKRYVPEPEVPGCPPSP